MKWEGCDRSECSIGGGEGTNLSRVEDERMLWMLCRLGRRSPHPLPSSKPAGEQRGGEQPGRRSLEGVGGVQGFLGKIFGLLLFKESHSQLLVCCGLASLCWCTKLQPGGLGRDELNESESFYHCNRLYCCLLLSVLDTALEAKVLANKLEIKFSLWMQ